MDRRLPEDDALGRDALDVLAERRVERYLRHCRNKSPRYLARRFRRSLGEYAASVLEEGGEPGDLLPAGQLAGLQLVGQVIGERARLLSHEERDAAYSAPAELATEALSSTLEALEDIAAGIEPRGLKTRYGVDEEAPAFAVVSASLAQVSATGKLPG
jgi:hypothetical protein